MDYLTKIDNIINRSRESGHVNAAERIRGLENAASVGSELLMSVTHELLMFINTDKQLKSLIEEDTIEIKKYCWSIGLSVR
jgi:hypothetical protein